MDGIGGTAESDTTTNIITPSRPFIHKKAQKVVKEKEGYCQVCELEGNIQENLEGHHLVPYIQNGSADSFNMISLCEHHHKTVAHGQRSKKNDEESVGVMIERF